MTGLSIRQLAEKLSVSHTAVRNAMADIEAESGIKMGTSQGAGRATLLNESEQALITQRFYKPVEDAPVPPMGNGIVHQAGMSYGVPGMTLHNAQPVRWNLDAIAHSKQQSQETGQQAVYNAAQIVQQFAAFKAIQTIQEIDAVFEGIKAGAINQGVAVLGKQQQGEEEPTSEPSQPAPSSPRSASAS